MREALKFLAFVLLVALLTPWLMLGFLRYMDFVRVFIFSQ